MNQCQLDSGEFGSCYALANGQVINLPAGQHALTVRATDAAGNVGAKTVHFTQR